MDFKQTMSELEKCGTAQTRKTYVRHGVKGDMFGVSYADHGKLKKKIGVDHDLAMQLWDSGNHDAQILATMIADPARATVAEVNKWIHSIDGHVTAGAAAGYIAKTKHAGQKIKQLTKSKDEWKATTGWSILASYSVHSDVEDDYLAPFIDTIESTIHQQKNFVRYAMNMALIAIGIRSAALAKQATAAAKKIGKVEVDHGDTSCKTPDAAAYIKKTRDRKKARGK